MLFVLNMDSGAGGSVLPLNCVNKIPNYSSVLPSNTKLRMANGDVVDAEGEICLMVNRANDPLPQPVKEKFYVYDGPHALMGRTLIQALEPELYCSMKKVAANSRDIQCNTISGEPTRSLPSASKQLSPSSSLPSASKLLPTSGVPADSRQFPNGLSAPIAESLTPCTQLTSHTNRIQEDAQAFCEEIDDAHGSVFDGKLGCFKGVEAKIHLKEGAKLKVMPAAKVPVGIQQEYNLELDKLYQEGTPVDGPGIKVESQIVPVVKIKDNKKKV